MSDIEKIRKRNSYKSFLELYEWLRTKPEPKAILVKIYNLLDSYHAFSSETNSISAQESVNQVIQDFEEEQLKITAKELEVGISKEDIREYMKENPMPKDPEYSQEDLIGDVTGTTGFLPLSDAMKPETREYVDELIGELM